MSDCSYFDLILYRICELIFGGISPNPRRIEHDPQREKRSRAGKPSSSRTDETISKLTATVSTMRRNVEYQTTVSLHWKQRALECSKKGPAGRGEALTNIKLSKMAECRVAKYENSVVVLEEIKAKIETASDMAIVLDAVRQAGETMKDVSSEMEKMDVFKIKEDFEEAAEIAEEIQNEMYEMATTSRLGDDETLELEAELERLIREDDKEKLPQTTGEPSDERAPTGVACPSQRGGDSRSSKMQPEESESSWNSGQSIQIAFRW